MDTEEGPEPISLSDDSLNAPSPVSGSTPGMAIWAFVLSLMGFLCITAILGVIFGFIGRGKAKQAGSGVGLATAAIIIGFGWIAVSLIGFVAVGSNSDSDSGGSSMEAASEIDEEEREAKEEEERKAKEEEERKAKEEEKASAGPGIGDPVRDGNFEFVVSGAECGVQEVEGTLDYQRATARGQFCLVSISVTNIGDEPQLWFDGAQEGLTDTGATVETDGQASDYASDVGATGFEDINPGLSIEGIVLAFDIAPDQTLEAVVLHDSTFSRGVKVALN